MLFDIYREVLTYNDTRIHSYISIFIYPHKRVSMNIRVGGVHVRMFMCEQLVGG